jgi:transketolase
MGSTNGTIDIRDAFFDRVYELAVRDRNVVFLTADMGAMAIDRFRRELPGQFVNVGVAEQNMVSVAAGMSLCGKNVYIYAIAPFVTMRCYEQIKVDLSGMRLPVTIVGAGPGIVYDVDGPTHHAIQDVAVMRALPDMTILSPSDSTLAAFAASIGYESSSPVYVRLDKGKYPRLYDDEYDCGGGLCMLKEGGDVLVVTTGVMVHKAFEIADRLEKEDIHAGILDLYRIKPLDEERLLAVLGGYGRIVTIEEHSGIGGIGSLLADVLTRQGAGIPVRAFSLGDRVCDGHGDREWLRAQYGIDVNSICKTIVHSKQTTKGK